MLLVSAISLFVIHSVVQLSTDIVSCTHLWNVIILFVAMLFIIVSIIVNLNLDSAVIPVANSTSVLNDS